MKRKTSTSDAVQLRLCRRTHRQVLVPAGRHVIGGFENFPGEVSWFLQVSVFRPGPEGRRIEQSKSERKEKQVVGNRWIAVGDLVDAAQPIYDGIRTNPERGGGLGYVEILGNVRA